jgi:hypothetical protein
MLYNTKMLGHHAASTSSSPLLGCCYRSIWRQIVTAVLRYFSVILRLAICPATVYTASVRTM